MLILRIKRNQKGFTLLELLVAVALLAIGLLATASMQGVAINADGVANRTTQGAALAQQVAEDLLSRTDGILSVATGGPIPFPILDPVAASPQKTMGANTYTATYTIITNCAVNGVVMNGLTRLVVAVNYLPGGVGPGVQVGNFMTYKLVI